MEKTTFSRIVELAVPALIAFAVTWGVYTAKSNAQEQDIKELQTKYETVLEMKGDLKVIRNDIEYIKTSLDRHLNGK